MVGFADDDAHKWRTQIHGYPVIGDYRGLVSLVLGGAVDTIIVSTRQIDVKRLRDLETLCAEHGVRLSRLQYDFHHLGTVS
jgi:FlaA1/EpsC-like NDP-sugar epimerase